MPLGLSIALPFQSLDFTKLNRENIKTILSETNGFFSCHYYYSSDISITLSDRNIITLILL